MKLYDEYQFFVSLNLKKILMSLLWWCEGVDVHRGIVGVEGCGGDVDGSREHTENANYICHMVSHFKVLFSCSFRLPLRAQ
jgi:hypothetical protein